MNDNADSTRSLRFAAYTLLIVAAASVHTARIFSVSAAGRDPQTPFLSANDRSRWATIRALVEEGTYAIDNVIFDPTTGKRASGWHTIDLVKHSGPDGQEHYYSSKPVLMPTLMAGVYWLVKQATGASLASHPFHVGRIVLWLCNIPPLVLMYWLLGRVVDRYGSSDRARLLTMTAATFGTFLSTFAITLNNHLHAAVCVTVATASLLAITERPSLQRARWHFVLAGLFSALALANELPALAFLVLASMAAGYLNWRATLLWFALPALVVVVAMVGTNYLAHRSWRPPYTHRNDGPIVTTFYSASTVEPPAINVVRRALDERLPVPISGQATLQPRMQVNPGQDVSHKYVLWDPATSQRFALEVDPPDSKITVREWDNWYEYEGTYWTAERKQGVDQGEPSRLVYALHCLVGHHGLFSLTPLWAVALAGAWIAAVGPGALRGVAIATLLLTAACLIFYIGLSPLQDRNYGGVCNGLRWMMWLIPLYLICLPAGLAPLMKWRWGQALALACLAVGVFSAWYHAENPWHHPWLFDYLTYQGVIGY